MGSCLGHLRSSRETFGLYKFYSKARESVSVQVNSLGKTDSEEHMLNELPCLQEKDEFGGGDLQNNCFCFERLKSVFSNVKNQYAEDSAFRLELLDDEWSVSEGEGEYGNRLGRNVNPSSFNGKENIAYTSASVNSLDLEWEHLPEMAVFSRNVEKEEPKSATSAEGWSRISSADSLEWDHVEVELKEELDTETEQLLHEIELLSTKALQETQEWTS